LYSVKADWPNRLDTVGELESLNWQYTSGFAKRARVETHDEHSTALDNTPNLKQIVTELRASLPGLLTYLYSNPEFKNHIWPGTTLEQLEANTSLVCELYRDDPGWTTGIHIDHRAAVATGMMFFDEQDNKRHATTFYTTEKGNNSQRMLSAYSNGWFSANTHRSWHTGGNQGCSYRYSVLFALFLRLSPR
jgi:hypothetical protein